jgi:hypothetical protein
VIEVKLDLSRKESAPHLRPGHAMDSGRRHRVMCRPGENHRVAERWAFVRAGYLVMHNTMRSRTSVRSLARLLPSLLTR